MINGLAGPLHVPNRGGVKRREWESTQRERQTQDHIEGHKD